MVMKKVPVMAALALAVAAALPYRAHAAPPEADQTKQTDTVSREEYEALKRDHEELKKQMKELLEREHARDAQPTTNRLPGGPAMVAPVAPNSTAPVSTPATQEDLDEIDKTLRDIKRELHDSRPGLEKIVIAGDAAFGFSSVKGSKSSFDAGIAPLILIQPYDRLLIEAAADIGIDNDEHGHSETTFDLTIANASFIVNDNLIVGGGLFVAPFANYHRHFDPPWINKLPDDPAVFSDGGLAPSSVVGFFANGAFHVSPECKILYDAYVSNGPNLETQDPGSAGQLHFDNYTDLNNNKAVGGRIAIQPITPLEVGYSIQFGKAGDTGFKDVDALLQAVDFQYRREYPRIYGTIDVNGAWVWSNVGSATYDSDGSLGFGPTHFSNSRNGGYVTLAYRPTAVSNKYLRKTDYIVRIDALTTPLGAPGGDHERRLTLGFDYWITPAAVVKFAYEFDHKKAGENADGFFMQLGLGL
jgi:hypothetical protein